MDDKTLEALKGSIKKWFRIAYNRGKDHGADNCNLCILYSETCTGCPVKSHMGIGGCIGTPWDEWYNYCRENNQNLLRGMYVFDEKSQELAIKEYRFLKSLLPE